MGTDPATSVCDSFGRTHDHENLFVVGAPTTPTGGCTNGTLTFVALTLRSAEEIARSDSRVWSPRVAPNDSRLRQYHLTAVNMISTAPSASISPAPTVARAGKSLRDRLAIRRVHVGELRQVRQIDHAVDHVAPVEAGGLERAADRAPSFPPPGLSRRLCSPACSRGCPRRTADCRRGSPSSDSGSSCRVCRPRLAS